MKFEDRLNEFLVEAKINTYASNGELGETKLADGSKEFRFEKGEFEYKDKYRGSESFSGEELISQNEKPIWRMSYNGGVTSGIIPSAQVYEFLKEALQKVTIEKPFRGPDNLRKDDWEYINKVEGTVDQFIGEEQILFKGEVVYRLNYHGGVIN